MNAMPVTELLRTSHPDVRSCRAERIMPVSKPPQRMSSPSGHVDTDDDPVSLLGEEQEEDQAEPVSPTGSCI